MKPYYRVSEAASLLRVSASTMRKYTAMGLIECEHNHAGQRIYTPEHIKAFLQGAEPARTDERLVFYVRASDGSQARLDNQVKLLKDAFGEPQRVFKDKASGLNEKRTGLLSMLERAKKHEFDVIAITNKDRLTRFGYSYLERLLIENQVKLVILSEDHKESLEEELMKDFMSLIASFSGKFYRLRGNEQRHRLLDTAKERLSDGEE